ncbi:MAG: hypothetical protein NZ699_13990 [Roseiflexus sp.]|nr:hypothetical protein [Roseiflexus sp.]
MERYEQELISPGQIDSLLKLRLVLLFAEYPWLRMSAANAQQRLRENPWAVAEALDELANVGLLSKTECCGETVFRVYNLKEQRNGMETRCRNIDDAHKPG